MTSSLIQAVAKFKLVEYQPPDGKWGAPVVPSEVLGEWNGMVNEVRDSLDSVDLVAKFHYILR